MAYPSVDFSYLRAITDCTGVIQHGTHGVPNRRLGYTTDDNARALIVATKQYDRTADPHDMELALVYLSYLHHAQTPNYKFRNVMTFQREFVDEEGTEDCFGRTMWGCGTAASSNLPENVRIVAKTLFEQGIRWVEELKSPRSMAYTMLGISEYLRKNQDVSLIQKLGILADRLVYLYKASSDPEWVWYEQYLTYGNPILPLAVLLASEFTEQKNQRVVALETMEFLTATTVIDDRLELVGNNGWYIKGQKRAIYDQQSIDAGYSVYAYARMFEILGEEHYLELARVAHSWFFGNNRNGLPVYNEETKGCYDGITPGGVNLNQGAESSICFLLAQLAMEKYQDGKD